MNNNISISLISVYPDYKKDGNSHKVLSFWKGENKE